VQDPAQPMLPPGILAAVLIPPNNGGKVALAVTGQSERPPTLVAGVLRAITVVDATE